MEAMATSRDIGPGSSSSSRWTYDDRHEQTGSAGSYTRSSRSGTIVSTAYTSGASRPSLSPDFELKIHGYDEHLPTKEEKMKRVIELVKVGATSALNLNLERWFTELRVAWVLDIPISDSKRELERTGRSWGGLIAFYAPCWINALAEIVEAIRFTSTLPLPDPCSHTTSDDEEQAVPNQFFLLMRVTTKILQRVKSKLFLTNNNLSGHASITDPIQFARFTQVAMLKMLAFVDVLVTVDFSRQYSFSWKPEIYSYHKSLNLLLDVHGVLSKSLQVIDVLFISSPPGEVETTLGEILRFLSTKEEKALDALWLTLNHTTDHLLKCIEDLSDTQTLQQASSDIHKVTLSVISHISFLMDNKMSLDLIISEVDNRGKVRIVEQIHSDSMIIRMASRLQEKLVSLSESFPDQGLMFLFLLNNSHQLHKCFRLVDPDRSSLKLYVESLFTKVDDYKQSYLQVSWAPVLSSLFNPTPSFLGKNHSPLTKFQSEFQKTYTNQKLWKVPDPELRKTMRTAVINKIIPCYTNYTQEKNITTPRLAPQYLEEMLQDLFEG